jgi:hypothetical protein
MRACICSSLVLLAVLATSHADEFTLPTYEFPVHDMNRPQPAKVDPKPAAELEAAARAPKDAVILFDGTSLDAWLDSKGNAPRWVITNGAMLVVAKTGPQRTKAEFGSCRLHVEFRTPSPTIGESQVPGNSGIFFMGQYEMQVLDCYTNRTYPDGTVGSVYSQNPPLVNACAAPGEWQYYDIDFTSPRFDANGRLTRPARLTAKLNGHLVQDNWTLSGPTSHKKRDPYRPHPPKLPLVLQDHGQPVQFRNIWIIPRED